MDTGRKCSHCGHNGHNSRTCNGKGLKLFGVRIMGGEEEEVMRKCSSMVNLVSCAADQNSGDQGGGYLSDGPVHGARRGGHERKRDPRHLMEKKLRTGENKSKGVPWTQEEHKTFLAGLKKLGKGDWRGISRNYVRTRTPTQVASHAQKYFLRRTIPGRKKRRSSLFDVEIKDVDAQSGTDPLQPKGTHEAAEEINLLRIDNYPAGTPAPSQVSVPSFEVSPMLPPTARCGEQPHFFGFKYMAGTSYSVKNQTVAGSTQVSPTLSFTPTNGFSSQVDPIPSELHDDAATGTPDFLRLSLNSSPQSPPACCPSTDDSLSMEASDLDLTIGPPKPLGTAKLSSGSGSNLTGAIRVT